MDDNLTALLAEDSSLITRSLICLNSLFCPGGGPGDGYNLTHCTDEERETWGGEKWQMKLENPGADFPGGLEFTNSPVNAGDMGSIPGLGRFHMLRDSTC